MKLCAAWRCGVVCLSAALALANSTNAADAASGIYTGIFVGAAETRNRIVDVDGFSNWGNPGYIVDYDDSGFVWRRADREKVRGPARPDRSRRGVRRPSGGHDEVGSGRRRRDGGVETPVVRHGARRGSSTLSDPRPSLLPQGWRPPGLKIRSPIWTVPELTRGRGDSIRTTPSATVRQKSAGRSGSASKPPWPTTGR